MIQREYSELNRSAFSLQPADSVTGVFIIHLVPRHCQTSQASLRPLMAVAECSYYKVRGARIQNLYSNAFMHRVYLRDGVTKNAGSARLSCTA